MRRYLLLCLLIIFFVPNAYGQTGIEQQIRNQDRLQRDLLNRHKFKSEDEQNIFLQPDIEILKKRAIPNKETACLPIKKVSLIEDHYLGLSPDFLSEAEGKCIGVSDIKNLVSDLNKFYQSQGFLTTRVYVPEQNLADGILELRVRPGIVSGFAYNTGAPPDNRILFAFPIDPGDIANLRDLEQGLENFNAPRSQSGKFKLRPGEKPGETIIQIDEKRSLPVHATVTYRNDGTKTSAQHSLETALTVDNLFNANDSLKVQHVTALPFDRKTLSNGYLATFKLPYRYWHILGKAIYTNHSTDLTSLKTPLTVSGHMYGFRTDILRDIWRGQKTKVSAKVALRTYRNRSFIEDIELKTLRRYVTYYTLASYLKHVIGPATIDAELHYRQGIDWLGAQKPLGNSFDPNFRMFSAGVRMNTSIFSDSAQLNTSLQGQWTNTKLPADLTYFMGSSSTVRGFRENYLTGKQGLTWKSDLTIPLYKTNWVSVSGKVGMDFGLVDPDPGAGLSDNKIAGASLGVRINLNDMLDIEAAYERPLYRPDQFSESPDIFYLSAQFGLTQTATEIADFIESLD